jgi:hypothetical protein
MFKFMPFLTLPQPDQQPLSQASRKVLSETIFSATQPNAIVPDFETFIEFLQLHKVEVSANQQAIAPKYLADLNSRLSHPVTIDLQRPSQKSYAYIHGLYLLLRGSAIAVVQLDKKKNILSVDPQVLNSWQRLNAIEKYFNLLATWIYYSSEGIMDNDRRALPEWFFVVSSWGTIAKEN